MGTALVTGATAGLGLEFAWQLATARHHLVLVARDEDRLDEVAGQLRAAAGVDVEVIRADLSVPDDVERVAERLRVTGEEAGETRRPVGLLVNNAGFGNRHRFVKDDLDTQLQALDVMVRAVLVLSHAAAGQMKHRGRGAILNVGSVAALLGSGTYAAHKAWVRAFTEGLASELRGTGVTATVVAPGLTHTEFHARMHADTSGLPEVAWLDAPRVVADALADVRRGVVLSTPSLRYKAASAFLRLAPRGTVRAIARQSRL
ncbi:short-chain dehydrogenase/reductase SDR [Xylanimonas cellulosilytica DSM 15894]|uniref:Short-chain dehydrogenase/reductase SDR n=1 Tax=Xylanimonas cellulosilytica (strain DSM 15894 / JCM 12276 / CECT 5975 / KCTC 9989 / LMG 20990 / NBRC 107835 / XIL07) TaxID=446471 RepID=D1C0E6_XYLCX|nr:SDR family NAD(P)-dependent oxidoreductase [Xylanimonas cellulosilytica]ACZ32149.1 short-chain dehydrogenase/reductase SDR [Xylanimonas cellulosilytica DSM 15894]